MLFFKCISKNKKRNLTIDKIYEVEAELFDLNSLETYAVEFLNDNGDFTELPLSCIEIIE